jgi:hypothetical protein
MGGGVVGALCLLFLTAGDAGRSYREGKELDEAGKDYKAAVAYISALEADAGHKKALEAIRLVARDAWTEKAEEARELEASSQFGDALASYQELGRLQRSLKELDAMTGITAVDANAKVTEMGQKAAEQSYAKGADAIQRKAWEEAVKHYSAALAYVTGYQDAGAKVAYAYYQWGEADLSSAKWRDAAVHFARSWKAGDVTDARRRSASVHGALATYFVDKGGCRQGVKDAKTALEIYTAPAFEDTLRKAQACAETPVAFNRFENPTGVNPNGMSVSDLLGDGVINAARAEVSSFVKIHRT